MSDILGRFEAAYNIIAEHHDYIDAQTANCNEPELLGISLERSSGKNALDNSQVRKIVYRHYLPIKEPAKPAGVHAELIADSRNRIDPYFAQTFAVGTGSDVIYEYREVWQNDDIDHQRERIMSFVERALAKFVLRPE